MRYAIPAMFLFLTASAIFAQSGRDELWDMVRRQDWPGLEKAAIAAEKLNADDPWPPYFLGHSYQQRAGGNPAFWEKAAAAYRRAGILGHPEPQRWLLELTWVLFNAQAWQELYALADSVLALKVPDVYLGNWKGSVFYVVKAGIEAAPKPDAFALLARAWKGLGSEARTTNLRYFFQPFASYMTELPEAERSYWRSELSLLMKQNSVPGLYHPFANLYRQAAWDAFAAGDISTAQAMAAEPAPYAETGRLESWHVRDDLELLRIALAAPRFSEGEGTSPANRRALFIEVPELDVVLPDGPGFPSRRVAGRIDDGAADITWQGFRIFLYSMETIAKGRVRWQAERIRWEGAKIVRISGYYDPSIPRMVIQPVFGNVDRMINPALKKAMSDADLIVFHHPGTGKKGEMLVTNGGGTEFDLPWDGKKRAWIVTEGNDTAALDSVPVFFHHEWFHLMEWAYALGPRSFPYANHPFLRRAEWPRDYSGSTEWDFYRETYLKRILVADPDLSKTVWRTGVNDLYTPFSASR